MFLTLIVASVAAAAPAEPIMPLAEVQPGMQATVRTVFEGGQVEEFGAEIVGVMDNFLGPNQNLILARLKGNRVEFTGVAAGMSGSPVYVDGRLVGALSYRLGQFLKEPIAGITPIEYMLEVGAEASSGLSEAGAALSAGGPDGMRPIETPVMVAGVPSWVLDAFAGDLSRLGLGRLVPGAAQAASSAPGPEQPVRPGDPIAVQLVRGDISVAATGTITLVEGDRVYAFGHPAFMNGAAELPMARAEIYLTLASLQVSNKMSRVLDTIGTFRESRLPALTGVIGPMPRMIPVTVRTQGTAGGPAARTFRYEVADHRVLTPTLLGLATAASLVNTPNYSDELTLALSGRVSLEGYPNVVLNDLYSDVSGTAPAAVAMARDIQGLFGAVYQNRFERVQVRSVELEVSTAERSRVSVVEGVYPTRTELQAGEEVEFRVLIRPHRGRAYTRRLTYRVPEGMPPGRLAAYIGGANLLGAAERNVLARQVSQADGLHQLIALINRLRTSNKLYLKVTRRLGGAIVLSEIMPALPPSILSTLGANRGTGEVTPLAETTIHEDEVPLDEVLVGGTVVPLDVR